MGRINERLRRVEQGARGLYQTLTLEDGTEVKYEPGEMVDAMSAVLEGEDHPLLRSIERMDPNRGVPSLMRALGGEGEPDAN